MSDASNEQDSEGVTVFARVKHTTFRDSISGIEGITTDAIPITSELVGDLVVAYAVDRGDSLQFISPHILRELDLSLERVQVDGFANTLMELSDVQVVEEGAVFQLHNAAGFASSSVLFPELWEQLEDDHGGELTAAFVHRDLVLFARSDSESAMKELRTAVQLQDFGSAHALSSRLFAFRAGGWVVQ